MTTAPILLVIAFIGAFFYAIILIANAAREGALAGGISSEKTNKIVRNIYLFFALWFTYVTIVSFSGVVSVNSLPPRPVLFFALPLLLFYILLTNLNQHFKVIVNNVSLKTLINVHQMRLIGAFFIVLWYIGLLPKEWAFPAGIGDVVSAILAVVVSFLVFTYRKGSLQLVKIWNVIGLLDIINALVTAVIITGLSAKSASIQDLTTLTKFPFVFVPAFAPPTIIFLHILTFKRLYSKKFIASPS